LKSIDEFFDNYEKEDLVNEKLKSDYNNLNDKVLYKNQ
jgi:hypothetical protein